MAQMKLKGIETRPGFVAPSEMKIYQASQINESERLARSVLVLPTYPGLSENQIERICTSLLNLRKLKA